MTSVSEPLSISILAIMYAGDVVFAVSGALNAARHRMDVLGFVLIGTITGIGGGTLRDLLMGCTVWWARKPVSTPSAMWVSGTVKSRPLAKRH